MIGSPARETFRQTVGMRVGVTIAALLVAMTFWLASDAKHEPLLDLIGKRFVSLA